MVVLGGYELHDPIGEGGQAVVHLARKKGVAGLSPLVAVKRLRAPDEARDVLAREALAAVRLRHANVVQVLDVVEDEGELLLVLELVVGASLATLVRRAKDRGARIPPPIACALVAGLLRGLEAAHDAKEGDEPLGLVHRDVAPENLLVDEHGTPKLADFGIARVKGGAGTTPDAVKGKLAYMAPEILRGEPFDARADVFAAGVVLYEALTGMRAFDGPDAAVARAIVEADLPAPSALADVPPALDAIVARSVTPTPEERFPSAAAMRKALEAAAPLASASEIAAFVEAHAGADLERLREAMRAIAREATDVNLVARPREASEAGPPPRTERPLRSRAPTLAAIAALLVGVVVVAAIVWARRSGTDALATPLPARETTPPSAAAPPAEAAREAPRAPSPSVSATAHASAAPHVRGPSTPRSRRCRPPWTIDEDGIKHYKDECL